MAVDANKCKQEIINDLQELESLCRALAHTYVKNIAHDEFDEDDSKMLKLAISHVRKFADNISDNLKHVFN